MHPLETSSFSTALPATLMLILCMLMPVSSEAAALGDELILSRLGDPVEVEIAVMQWEDIDLAQVQISAGTPEVYESFGLDYLPVLESLSFNAIGPSLDGEVKVLVSSREPMNEPYLQLLLVMRWPGGSLLREYVLLFDPPRTGQTAPAPDPVVATTPVAPAPFVPESAPSVPESAPVPAPAPEIEQQVAVVQEPVQEQIFAPGIAIAEPEPAIQVEAENIPVSEIDDVVSIRQSVTYTVQSGDNLWDIATNHGPVGANANLYQILLSLYELNRGSFINGNISLLKYGVTLQLPTTADVARIDPATAQELFDQRWNEGSERIGMAQRGEPLPPLSSIFAPEVTRPEINPTAGFQENNEEPFAEQANGGLLIGSDNRLAPDSPTGAVQTRRLPLDAPVPPGQTTGLSPGINANGEPTATSATAITVTSSNPYLEGINTSVKSIQETLAQRQQQVEMLEIQMREMSTRMLEISRVTERLNTSLEAALSERDRQQASSNRNTLLLGGLVLALSAALIVIIVMVLKLVAQIRVQHQLLQRSINMQPVAGPRTNDFTDRPGQAGSLPDSAKSSSAKKHLTAEQALAVPIIEEQDDEQSASNTTVNAAQLPEKPAPEGEVDVSLGDMEIDQPEEERPDSK